MTRRRSTAIGMIGAIALLLATAGGAGANTVSYLAEIPASKLQPGQSKGLPVFVGLDLRGRKCPLGRRCFKNAKALNFHAVSWAYPNCPDVLDSSFELNKTVPARRKAPHRFSASGPNANWAPAQVTIRGRFPRHGRVAKGWFTVTDSGCTTGRIYFTATRV